MQHWRRQKVVQSWSLMKRSIPSSGFGVYLKSSRLKALNQPFELICEMGSLSKPESLAVQQTDPTAATRLLQNTCEALWQVSAWEAKASVQEDRIRILEEIANAGRRKLLKNLGFCKAINFTDPDHTTEMFREFDQFSQALLSSALLRFCLMHNDYAAAAKCCEKGACFTKEQFARINTHVREEDRTSWLSNLLILNTKDNRLDIVGLLLQSRVCMEAVHFCLVQAAEDGNEAVTKLLLDNGANVAAAGNNGKTALLAACLGGHETVTKLLLDHGADVAAADIQGKTALLFATKYGHEAVTKLLLDNGANLTAADINGQTALLLAALGGHEAVTKLLLDHGADLAAANINGQTALMHAAWGAHEAVTKLLLDNGADVAAGNEEGRTVLMVAAQCGHVAVAKLLLDNGANVAAADNNGQTVLIYAAIGGSEAVTKLLLDHGADVAAPNNDGSTALMVAAKLGHEALTELLLDNGANVAAADINGQTALLLAALRGHEAATRLLLDHGADVAAAEEQWSNCADLCCY